jgi:uncharacterized coiled-coil protein SlyX
MDYLKHRAACHDEPIPINLHIEDQRLKPGDRDRIMEAFEKFDKRMRTIETSRADDAATLDKLAGEFSDLQKDLAGHFEALDRAVANIPVLTERIAALEARPVPQPQ